MTRIASAPASRWAATCSVKTVKSFASAGSPAARRAAVRSPRLPPKSRSAHSTDMAAAPPAEYARAVSATSAAGAIEPCDGDARLISATTAMSGPAVSASAKPRAGSGAARRMSPESRVR